VKASEFRKLIREEVRRALMEGMSEGQVQNAFKMIRGNVANSPTPAMIKTLQTRNPSEYQQLQDALTKIMSSCKAELALANEIMDKWTKKYVFNKVRPKV